MNGLRYTTMLENIIVGLVFLAALGYLLRTVRQQFASKQGCGKGCGSCGGIDFKKTEAGMKSKE